jgi:hypothetical protein
MRLREVVVAGVVLVAGCAAPIKQFYPGSFFPEDRTYQNKPIGFSLTYKGSWELTTNPNEMEENRIFARQLHTTGVELLFIGFTAEKTQGTRCIASNANEPNREYAEQIQRINKGQIDSDSGLADDTVHSIPMVRWEYSKNEIRFVEYFFTVDTYNLRVAFWTTPLLFGKFIAVYREIMGTLQLTDRY